MLTDQPRHPPGGNGRPVSQGVSSPSPTAVRTDSTVRAQSHAPQQESIPHLVRSLAHDVSDLIGKEAALARAELREAANEAKAGIASLSMGGGLAFAGLLVLLMSAVYGLATVMDLWLSALIVGAAALLIGFAMIKSAQKKMEPEAFKPDRTIEEMREDKEAARRAVK